MRHPREHRSRRQSRRWHHNLRPGWEPTAPPSRYFPCRTSQPAVSRRTAHGRQAMFRDAYLAPTFLLLGRAIQVSKPNKSALVADFVRAWPFLSNLRRPRVQPVVARHCLPGGRVERGANRGGRVSNEETSTAIPYKQAQQATVKATHEHEVTIPRLLAPRPRAPMTQMSYLALNWPTRAASRTAFSGQKPRKLYTPGQARGHFREPSTLFASIGP